MSRKIKIKIKVAPYLRRVKTKHGKKRRVIRAHSRAIIKNIDTPTGKEELAKQFFIQRFMKSPEQNPKEFEQWKRKTIGSHPKMSLRDKEDWAEIKEKYTLAVIPQHIMKELKNDPDFVRKQNEIRLDLNRPLLKEPKLRELKRKPLILGSLRLTEKSMADKVKELGINSDQFKKDIFELDDIITEKLTIPIDYSSENIRKEVYPKLRELKQKYGMDIPIGLVGVDLQRLERKLDFELENKKIRKV